MNDETLKPDNNRSDGLEGRIKTIEDHKRGESRGWAAKIGLMGIVVGCLGGILGGTDTLLGLWKEFVATPNIALFTGGPLDVSWDQNGRRLTLTCGLVLNNNGRAPDVVTAVRAYIRTGIPAAREPLHLDPQIIHVSDKGIKIRLPLSVKASEMRDIEVTISSELTPEMERAFFETGLHEIILEFDTSEPKRRATYCFWLGQEAANVLVKTGSLAYKQPDPRRTSGDQ